MPMSATMDYWQCSAGKLNFVPDCAGRMTSLFPYPKLFPESRPWFCPGQLSPQVISGIPVSYCTSIWGTFLPSIKCVSLNSVEFRFAYNSMSR